MSFGCRRRLSLMCPDDVGRHTVTMSSIQIVQVRTVVGECRRRWFDRMSARRPLDKSINAVSAALVALMVAEVVATTPVVRVVGGST